MVDQRPASWLPFVIVALSLASGTMGATMASPLYPIYEQVWQISHATTTMIYVVYMIAVLGTLLSFGRWSSYLSPVAVIRVALILLLLGLGLSATASGPLALSVGRAIIGVGSGLISTAATIGLLRLEPKGPRRASLVASMTAMTGFGLGPLVCGLIAQFATEPLVTPYVAVAVPIAVIFFGLLWVPTGHSQTVCSPFSLKPALGLPHGNARAGFYVASFAVFSAYALFSLLASLAPSFLAGILPWRGPAMSGIAVAAVLFCSALVQFPARRLPPGRCVSLALGAMTAGALLLAGAMRFGGTALFIGADIGIGTGHGLSFMAGLLLVNSIAREEHHAGILATFLSIAYSGAIVPILAVGYLADTMGLSAAVVGFCLTFVSICLALFALSRRVLRPER